MAGPQCIIAGHSHIAALGVPIESDDGTNKLVKIPHENGRFVGLTGVWPRERSYWRELARVSEGRIVALFWQGNQHQSRFLFAPEKPFDFVLADNVALPVDETVDILPEEVLRTLFSSQMETLGVALDAIMSAGGVPVLCGTPAPRGLDSMIRTALHRERHFRILAEQMGTDLDSVMLTPPLLRFKLWSVVQAMLRGAAAEKGLAFVPVPPATLTGDGFLRPEYCYRDVTHANADYGRAMLDWIDRSVLQQTAGISA